MSRKSLPTATAGLMLAVLTTILIWNCARVGITLDEPTRLLGGYLYWMNLPDAAPQDQPPLLGIVTGWAPRLLDIPLYRDHEIWKTAWKDHVSSFILDQLPGDVIGRLMFLARLGVVMFPLLTALLLWRWSGRLFGPGTALLVLLLFLLLPSARGHGALITSDMAASFTYLLSAFLAWRYWGEPAWRRAAWLGLGAGLAAVAKLSLLIVPPLAALVILCRRARVSSDGPAHDPAKTPRLSSPAAALRTAGHLALSVALAYLVILAAYKFDTRRYTGQDLAFLQSQELFHPWLLQAIRVFEIIPLPADLQRGLQLMGGYYKTGAGIYFFGDVYQFGHWAYFPACLALKTPIGFQILALGGLAVLAAGLLRKRIPADRLFLIAPCLIYLGFAMHSSIQLGIRLILPSVVFLVLIAGYAIQALLRSRWGQAVLTAVFAFIAVSTGRVFPHDISYFNEWAGGPEHGWRYLSDSNIDWGHNLPDLAAYMKRQGIERIRAFHFGFDKPHRYFRGDEWERMPSPWTPHLIEGRVFRPGPGLYAVHVSLLGGQYYPLPYRDYLQAFRDREPDARPGYGIFVYRIPPR